MDRQSIRTEGKLSFCFNVQGYESEKWRKIEQNRRFETKAYREMTKKPVPDQFNCRLFEFFTKKKTKVER
jgi:hypothetical protein